MINTRTNPLADIFNWPLNTQTANSTPSIVTPRTQTLPNGGGTFNPAGDSTISPAPIFTGAQPVNQIKTVAPKAPQRNFYKKDGSYYYSDTNQKILNTDELGMASKTGVEVAAPGGQTSVTQIEGVNYDKYRDPKTGEIMTPEEYAVYLGNKVPKGNGEITNYAGDALSNPNESAAELSARAANLNNSRNDISTGTTDPYGVGNTSGVAYSPAELKAIESAYAGVYDPALNDVFARLKETQEAEKQKADLQTAKEMEVFKTNESIRQWRATTGTKQTGGSGGEEKSKFTQTQLNNGASNAGMSLPIFETLDDDIKNFYINTPVALNDEGKKVPIYQIFNTDFDKVINGDLSPEQLSEDITGSTLPPAVKHYFIEQIPEAPEKKEKWLSKVWRNVKGAVLGQ